ncbi:MAG: HAD family hydrolase [Eubacteriales bacterium]|nr:HAD family hydrolase [Eubacteriales bacterium]
MDGIIFDVDGTLWDSTGVVAVAYNRVIEENTEFKLNVDSARLKTLFGKPMDEIFKELLPMLSHEEQVRLGSLCFEQEHLELEKVPGTCYPGLEETFRILAERYPLFIVSNCQCGYIELFLRKTGLGKYIKAHLCFGETRTSKGQTILRVMRENGLKEPVYVGDVQGDANACKEAQIPFVYAEYGFGSVKEEDIDYRISELKDLCELF